jgi:putative ABC transport system substrate-binding protein
MKRRNFIALLGGAGAWPLTARAQQPGLPVVGLVWVAGERVVKPYEESIRAGLRELGWVDGSNVRLEVDLVGRLPTAIEFISFFAAGTVATSKEADAASALIAFLTAPAVHPLLKAKGMDPA